MAEHMENRTRIAPAIGMGRGGFVRRASVCILAAGFSCLLVSASGSPDGVGGSVQSPVDSAAAGVSELDSMKNEFAALMKQRAALTEQCRESALRVGAVKDRAAENPKAGTEAGQLCIEARAKVESALANNPRMMALQAQYDSVHTQRVSVARQKAEIGTVWRKGYTERVRKFKSEAEAAGKKADDARAAILKQAGVSDPRDLTETDRARISEIDKQLQREVAAARDSISQAREKELREKDGSQKRFSDLAAQNEALEARQAELKAQMDQLRASLRKSDPAIAALQSEAAEAGGAYVATVESSREVVAARKFIERAQQMRDQIDGRANALRKAIIEKDPAYKTTLDAQGAAAGFGA